MLDVSLAGAEVVCKAMEASVTPSGVVSFEEDKEGDGCDDD